MAVNGAVPKLPYWSYSIVMIAGSWARHIPAIVSRIMAVFIFPPFVGTSDPKTSGTLNKCFAVAGVK